MKYFFEVNFYEGKHSIDTIQSNYLLFFVLQGSVGIRFATDTKVLRSKDVLLVNGNRHFNLQSYSESFFISITIRSELLRELTHVNSPYFQCCSTNNSSVKYEQLRYLLYDLLGEYAIDAKGMNAKKLSDLYKICDHLIQRFLLSNNPSHHQNIESRLDPVFAYIAEHFSEPVSLSDAAMQIHVAPESLSRLFKKTTGITFIQYLTDIRLNNAVSELLNTQLPVSEIALNSGFSTASQFNRIFKQKYSASPGEYRQQSAIINDSNENYNPETAAVLLNEYRSKTRMVVVKEQKIRLQSETIDCSKGKEIKNPWGDLLYLGFASHILSGTYQRQIQFLKKNLDIQYGSINGLFSPEFELIDQNNWNLMNFTNLDYVLDFFVENGIRPLIIFDNKIVKFVKNLREIQEISITRIFSDGQQFLDILDRILEHVINRYGQREVSSWQFTVWYYVYKQTLMGLSEDFLEIWEGFYKTVKKRIPKAHIGGVSYGPSLNQDKIVPFYRNWAKTKYFPDFITINAFPYREAEKPTKMNAIRQNVDQFFSTDLNEFRSILKEAEFPERPVVVMEWNLSFVQRNAFNDLAAKAAIMINQMSEIIDEVDKVCYWHASDIFAGDFDANKALNGSCGLISTDGFCKPSYYALLFFKQLHSILVKRGNHFIVTKDGLEHYVIILFNNKSLNYEYYSKDENTITSTDVEKIFNDHDSLEISLTLQGVSNRKYHIRRQIYGPECGSILDEWNRLGTDSPLTLSEISYLRQQSVPHRKNNTVIVKNHTLPLQEVLHEHEIMLIQID